MRNPLRVRIAIPRTYMFHLAFNFVLSTILCMFKHAWYFFVVAFAGWMNRQQTEVIEHLKEENRVLRERLGPKRLILTIPQKLRLATAAARLNRRLLREYGRLFSPDTLLRWTRRR